DPKLPLFRSAIAVHGDQERQGLHETGGDLQEEVPFPGRPADHANPELLQIPQPAMDQAGGLPARSAREVPLLDESRSVAPHRRGKRRPRADDSASDHEHVHRLAGHRRQIRRARSGGELLAHAPTVYTLPGFMIPFGSRVRFRSRRSRHDSSPIALRRYAACPTPIPWWWLRCPPVSRIARVTAPFTASYWTSSSPRFWQARNV